MSPPHAGHSSGNSSQSKHQYTLRGTGRFAISRLQGSEAEQTKRGHLEHRLRLLCTAALRAGTAPLEPPPVSPAHGPLPWPTADQGLRRLGNPRSNRGLESPHRGPGAWLPVHGWQSVQAGLCFQSCAGVAQKNTTLFRGVLALLTDFESDRWPIRLPSVSVDIRSLAPSVCGENRADLRPSASCVWPSVVRQTLSAAAWQRGGSRPPDVVRGLPASTEAELVPTGRLQRLCRRRPP